MSMQGYNLEEAVEYFLSHIDQRAHRAFSPSELQSLLRLCAEADLDYMEESGVLKQGVAGDAYYDDDDAFEYIDARLCRLTGANEEKSMHIAALIDDYMDLQQSYLESKGLLEWD